MEVDLALLADAATIDGSGKLNVLGVFDRLATTSFPTRHGRLSLVLRFAAGLAEAGRHAIQIVLRAPDGKELMRLDGEMQLGVGPSGVSTGVRVPHVLNVEGLIFPVPGSYTFDVRVDGEHQVAIPLSVDGPERSARA